MGTVELEGVLDNRNLRKLRWVATFWNFCIVIHRENGIIPVDDPDINNRDRNIVHANSRIFRNFGEGLNVFFFETLGLTKTSLMILCENIGKGCLPGIGNRKSNVSSILESNFDWSVFEL